MFTVFVNQVQAYQYRKFILHWDQMTKYKFWRVFLRTDDKWIGYVWENPEPSDIVGTTVKELTSDFESDDRQWNGAALADVGSKAHSGSKVISLDENNVYSNTLIMKSNAQLFHSRKPAVVVSGYINDKNRLPSDKLQLIVSYDGQNGESYFYRARNVDNFVDWKSGWKRFEVAMRLDTLHNESDIVKIYFWNVQKEKFLIDDVSFQIVDRY
jgi:hypothetical protein